MSLYSRLAYAFVLMVLPCDFAAAQDMMRHVDLNSPQMTQAEMTRDDVVAELGRGTPEQPADLTGRQLNGLDLSGLDFSGAILRRVYLNKAKLIGAKLDGAVLDQAWAWNADFTAATLRGSSVVAAQMRGARFDDADLSGSRITADLQGASLLRAKLVDADLGADMKNQSMGWSAHFLSQPSWTMQTCAAPICPGSIFISPPSRGPICQART